MQQGTWSENGSHQHFFHLTDEHVNHLLSRGLTRATIEAAGLWSASAEQVVELLGFNPRSAGIVIPYRHPLTGEVVLNRVRPDTPPILNGKPAKYLSPRGARNHLYWPPDCAALLRDTAIPFLWTEGEFKVLMAWQYGRFAVSGVGVWGWRGKDARGEVGPVEDLDLLNCRDRVGTIFFDSDVAKNEKVREACEAFAREAYRRGARVIYNAKLPALDGQKTGLDDLLNVQGVEAVCDLDAEEIASPYPRVKLWTGIELRETRMERPPAIVEGWGVRKAGEAIFTGMGGRGKSTCLSQIGIHMGAGSPLFGYAPLSINGPQRVTFFMAEDPLSEVRFRWVRQMETLGYGNEVAERIAFLEAQGSRLMLTDEPATTALFDALRRHRTDVCFLDPLVCLHDRDENSNAQMRAVLDLLAPFQEETACTFIVAHHEPKAPESNGAASRGASAIRDWCRTMLRLTSQKPSPDGASRFQLDLDKANYGGTVWSLTLERRQDSYLFTPIDLEAAVTPRDVWDLIGRDGSWLDEVQDHIIEQFSVSKATAYRAIKKAEEKQLAVVGEKINPETNRKKSYLTRGTGKGSEE